MQLQSYLQRQLNRNLIEEYRSSLISAFYKYHQTGLYKAAEFGEHDFRSYFHSKGAERKRLTESSETVEQSTFAVKEDEDRLLDKLFANHEALRILREQMHLIKNYLESNYPKDSYTGHEELLAFFKKSQDTFKKRLHEFVTAPASCVSHLWPALIEENHSYGRSYIDAMIYKFHWNGFKAEFIRQFNTYFNDGNNPAFVKDFSAFANNYIATYAPKYYLTEEERRLVLLDKITLRCWTALGTDEITKMFKRDVDLRSQKNCVRVTDYFIVTKTGDYDFSSNYKKYTPPRNGEYKMGDIVPIAEGHNPEIRFPFGIYKKIHKEERDDALISHLSSDFILKDSPFEAVKLDGRSKWYQSQIEFDELQEDGYMLIPFGKSNSGDGALIGYVRLDLRTGHCLPFSKWKKQGENTSLYLNIPFLDKLTNKSPLLNQNLINERKSAKILLTHILPLANLKHEDIDTEHVWTSWAGGIENIKNVDWERLRGRKVFYLIVRTKQKESPVETSKSSIGDLRDFDTEQHQTEDGLWENERPEDSPNPPLDIESEEESVVNLPTCLIDKVCQKEYEVAFEFLSYLRSSGIELNLTFIELGLDLDIPNAGMSQIACREFRQMTISEFESKATRILGEITEVEQPENRISVGKKFAPKSLGDLEEYNKKREYLCAPFLLHGSISILYGSTSTGKTWLALSLAYLVSIGGKIFHTWHAKKPRKVLYLDSEMDERSFHDRLHLIRKMNFGVTRNKIEKQDLDENLKCFLKCQRKKYGSDDDHFFSDLKSFVVANKIEFIVMDNLSSFTRHNDSAGGWENLNVHLNEIQEMGCSCLIVHHSNKKDEQRGSSAKTNTCDNVIRLEKIIPEESSIDLSMRVIIEKGRDLYSFIKKPFVVNLLLDDKKPSWSTASEEENVSEEYLGLEDEAIFENMLIENFLMRNKPQDEIMEFLPWGRSKSIEKIQEINNILRAREKNGRKAVKIQASLNSKQVDRIKQFLKGALYCRLLNPVEQYLKTVGACETNEDCKIIKTLLDNKNQHEFEINDIVDCENNWENTPVSVLFQAYQRKYKNYDEITTKVFHDLNNILELALNEDGIEYDTEAEGRNRRYLLFIENVYPPGIKVERARRTIQGG